MNEIGGLFLFEQLPEKENGYIERIGGDVRYLMSGRCGIYYALEDLKLTDAKRVAYLPVYTCETVIGPYLKAGYTVYYYDVDQNLRPIFDEAMLEKISLLHICGYYGFSTYDHDFVARCKAKNITILEDITHSAFSTDGIDPHCDYVAGSLRKWLGVPSGGLAFKMNGHFTLEPSPFDEVHLTMRTNAMRNRAEALQRGDEKAAAEASDLSWSAEMMLRQIFADQISDQQSIEIIRHYPVQELITRRQSNYRYLLEHFTPSEQVQLIFATLPDGVCPSHFTLYAQNRPLVQEKLAAQKIHTTAYWPIPPFVDLTNYPNAQYIYDHIFSIPCDQRYNENDMHRISKALNAL